MRTYREHLKEMHARIDALAADLASETLLDMPIVDDRFQQVMIIGGDLVAGACTTTYRTIQNLRHNEMVRMEHDAGRRCG